MAFGYLKLVGNTGAPVRGASTDAGRMGWTEVVAFSFAAQQTGLPGMATRPGEEARWEMNLHKHVDVTSPLIAGYRGDGRKFRSALLEILPGNPQAFHGSHDRPTPVPEVIYLFEDVGIAEVQQTIQGSDALEIVAFDAARMGWSYRTTMPPAKTYAPGDKLAPPPALNRR